MNPVLGTVSSTAGVRPPPSTGDALDQFRKAMMDAGITPPDLLEADGRLHRFASDRRRGDDSGYYLLHLDGLPAGMFGCWRAGIRQTWHAESDRTFTPEERRQHRERIEAMRRQRQADEAERQRRTADWAQRIWHDSTPGDAHPYLVRKAVKSYGLRASGYELLVPMATDGEIVNVQRITPDGEKKFLPGGRVRGCYFAIGKPDSLLCVVEGYATGASVHEATGAAVAIAFSAGNLLAVAKGLRAKFPDVRIVICGDHDASGTGQHAALEAARAVGGLVAIPSTEGNDWNDVHRTEGLDGVRAGIEAAREPDAEPNGETDAQIGADAGEQSTDAPGDPAPWPEPLAKEAYHGIIGEIVDLIEPQTEADPAAILLQTLVAFGATVGRGPHVRVEGDQHHAALYAVIVGESSKARKGTSWGRVKQIFSGSKDWPGSVDGLSSGEGLKYHVRDPREEDQFDKKKHTTETVLVDPGVTDKRLLVVESEFAQALRQTARSGNTLSATVRAAWDTGELRTLTKNDPITATGAHVCIIGHITIPELRAELTQTDTANGFANRFLFALVKRSKLLPFGGEPLDPDVLADLAARLNQAIEHACTLHEVRMTEAARTIWASLYPELSQSRPGLLGAVTARSEPQTLRLALIYALADCSSMIDAQHLIAALAVTKYAQQSATYIFGDSLGDPVADELLEALRRAGDEGLSRTAMRDLLGRHQRAERINAALELLATRGLARRTEMQTGGRPSEVWRAATKATKATKGGAA